MNPLTNILLGELAPGAMNSASMQAGAAQTNVEATGTAFQDLLTETLGETAPQAETCESWAGQQVVNAGAEEPETEVTAEAPQNLLGSADITTVIPEAVAATSIVTPQPKAQIADPVIEAEFTATEASPVAQTRMIGIETDRPVTNTGTDQSVQSDVPVDASEAAEVTERKSDVPRADLVSADESAQGTVTSDQEIGEDESTAAGVWVNEQTATGTAKVSERLHVSVHESKGAKPHSWEQARYSLHVKADDAPVQEVAQTSSVTTLALPEAAAPVAAAPTLDYQSLRLKLKLDVDTKPHERIHEKAMLSMKVTTDHIPADLPVTTDSASDTVSAVTGKMVFSPETLKSIHEVAVPALADTESGKQSETSGQTDQNLALAQSDLRPSFERSVIGAERSQGFHMPERVIEQKVIHQIVQSAKVQMTDGGASMTLRLDPPHLGTVQMDITAQQGLVMANIRTSTEAARHVLEADMSSLKQSLADAGITVDSINVSLGEMPDYTSTAHGQEQFERRSHGTHNPHRFGVAGNGDDTEPAAVRAREHRMTAATLDYLA